MVTSEYVKAREKENLKRILKNIKNKTENQVNIITTDGLTSYTNVVKKTFGYNNKEGKCIVGHNAVSASQEEGFNHPIERLHNSIRHRTKTFRGFHGKKGPYELDVPELKLGVNVSSNKII